MPDARLLISLLTLFWIVTLPFILKRDLVFGAGYVMLFVYTIFTQIGYVSHPELSYAVGLYRGRVIFYQYWLFVFLSFLLTAGLFALVNPRRRTRYALCCGAHVQLGQIALYAFAACYDLLLFCSYLLFQNSISYSMRASDVTGPLQLVLFLFQWHKILILVLYAKTRILRPPEQVRAKAFDIALLTVTALLHLLFALHMGARGELVFICVGLSTMEIAKAKGFKLRHLRILAPLAIVLGYGLTVLEYTRSVQPTVTVGAFLANISRPSAVFGMRDSAATQIVANDYLWPSHLLITAMDSHEVDPGEVFQSNGANALMGLHYPYLSEILSRNMSTYIDRINGFAFYILIEGYVAAGWGGVIYNAVLLNVMFAIWRTFSSSSDHLFNSAVLGLLATFAPAVIRAQSSWFVKDTWLFIFPGLILLLLASGLRLRRGAG